MPSSTPRSSEARPTRLRAGVPFTSDIRVEVERVVEQRNGWLVLVRAFNEGGGAATEVTIGGELTAPDGTVESAELCLDYLPSWSDRQGGLFFTRDPRAHDLKVRALGYAEP